MKLDLYWAVQSGALFNSGAGNVQGHHAKYEVDESSMQFMPESTYYSDFILGKDNGGQLRASDQQ